MYLPCEVEHTYPKQFKSGTQNRDSRVFLAPNLILFIRTHKPNAMEGQASSSSRSRCRCGEETSHQTNERIKNTVMRFLNDALQRRDIQQVPENNSMEKMALDAEVVGEIYAEYKNDKPSFHIAYTKLKTLLNPTDFSTPSGSMLPGMEDFEGVVVASKNDKEKDKGRADLQAKFEDCKSKNSLKRRYKHLLMKKTIMLLLCVIFSPQGMGRLVLCWNLQKRRDRCIFHGKWMLLGHSPPFC